MTLLEGGQTKCSKYAVQKWLNSSNIILVIFFHLRYNNSIWCLHRKFKIVWRIFYNDRFS